MTEKAFQQDLFGGHKPSEAKHVARVVVELSLDKEFDYLIPEALLDQVSLGSLVRVPFRNQWKRGYVLEMATSTDIAVNKLKPIKAVIGTKPLLLEPVVQLLRWMAEYYAAPIEKAVQAVIPSIVRKRNESFKQLTFVGPGPRLTNADALDQIKKTMPRLVHIAEYFLAHPEDVTLQHVVTQLKTTSTSLHKLASADFLVVGKKNVDRSPSALRHVLPTQPLELMESQKRALEQVVASIDTGSPETILLLGVTGSGKTEVYLQAIQHARNQGKGAIVLVPEISLTPQTVERFQSRFGDDIAVLHSHLSDGERHDEWHRLYEGTAHIAIGARSALFAPVRNPGLIVVDEEHENSYKQDEMPRYNARDVAVMRGRVEHCSVLLGSATPSLESYANALSGKYALAVLPERADFRSMPLMNIIDMRNQKTKDGHNTMLSNDLIQAVEDRLRNGEQVILFLNRRGFSRSLQCPSCGFVMECPDCSIPLTYHKVTEEMRCHLCGHQRGVPAQCPECRDPAFRYAGYGTQRIEEMICKCFPKARIERMDSDVTSRKEAYERILGAFRSGKIDILIGTQMIAKGHHFPNVTLVGVINADTALNLPDFRAGERTFQLLTQVAGRAGRGEVPGEVMIQTFTPCHPVIQSVRRLDYIAYADEELAARQEFGYPPYRRMICLTFRGPDEAAVGELAFLVERRLRELFSPNQRISPAAPAPIARIKAAYRYQIILIVQSIRPASKRIRYVLDRLELPEGYHVVVDIDALNTM
ncbi:MAG: primosomal protein N' [Spartobacteria bacterium]|nr:primosomal protein N' [Spartobacteria bacterium]